MKIGQKSPPLKKSDTKKKKEDQENGLKNRFENEEFAKYFTEALLPVELPGPFNCKNNSTARPRARTTLIIF